VTVLLWTFTQSIRIVSIRFVAIGRRGLIPNRRRSLSQQVIVVVGKPMHGNRAHQDVGYRSNRQQSGNGCTPQQPAE